MHIYQLTLHWQRHDAPREETMIGGVFSTFRGAHDAAENWERDCDAIAIEKPVDERPSYDWTIVRLLVDEVRY